MLEIFENAEKLKISRKRLRSLKDVEYVSES